MIRIIRSKDTVSGNAGEVFDFDGGDRDIDAWGTCVFLWGKGLVDYIIIRDGLIRQYENGNLEHIETDLRGVSL